MSAPLYGYQPRPVPPHEVFADCVSDYTHSESRFFIWEGIKTIIARTAELHPSPAQVHIDSEFVEATRDPSHAALLLEAQMPCTMELVALWKADNVPDWLVQTYLLPCQPTDGFADKLQAWQITRDELMADLSENKTKGYPITELHECHAYTKS